MQASNGKLYGMTNVGGTNNLGVIFSYDITASQYSVVYNFDGANGSNPQRTVTQASNGMLYGTTNSGGLYGQGAAFKFDIATNTYTKIMDFSPATGYSPQSDIQEGILP